MAIEVTEDPTKARFSLKPPWTAYREFIVTAGEGVLNDLTCLSATDATTALQVPQINDSHNRTSLIKCAGPEIKDKKGVAFWAIGCDYAVPTGGLFPVPDENPLLLPPRVVWSRIRESGPVDIDAQGRPIMNAAADKIQGVSGEISGFQFTVYRNEPVFDIAKSQAYSMSESDRDIIIDGVTFPKWRLALIDIMPAGEYPFGADYVTMCYVFQAYLGTVRGTRPFQTRVPNIGDNGYFSEGGSKHKGRFCSEHNDPTPGIRLNLDGTPVAVSGNTTKVLSQSKDISYAAVSSPHPFVGGTHYLDSEAMTGGGYTLYFARLIERDITPILFG